MNAQLPTLLYVALGGALGASLRYLVAIAIGPWATASVSGFPVATITVNVLGSLLMGLLAGLAAHIDGFNQTLRPFLMVGLLGGFTTFSSFSLDTVYLWERGAYAQAAGYVTASVLLSVLGFFAGLATMRSIL